MIAWERLNMLNLILKIRRLSTYEGGLHNRRSLCDKDPRTNSKVPCGIKIEAQLMSMHDHVSQF